MTLPYASLSFRIELRRNVPPAGAAVLFNHTAGEVRVWRMGNSWGDETLSFVLVLADRTHPIVPKQHSYTRNIPVSLPVAPGGRHEIPFDLGDGGWEPSSAIELAKTPGARLAAVYRVPDSPEAESQGVWRGELRSETVVLA